ncbi:MAG: hypothetical protein WAS27_02190 [Candidatus Saccharimonadales bacterium]
MTISDESVAEFGNNLKLYARNHWRQLVVIGFITITTMVAVRLFLTYAIIDIKVVGVVKPDDQIAVTFNTLDTDITTPGIHVIPRNTKGVTVQTKDHIRTQSPIDIPWYGFFDKQITLKQDMNADKIAYRSTLDDSCGLYNVELQRMYQYDCGYIKSITYFNTPENNYWTLEGPLLRFAFKRNSTAPYLGGVIGFVDLPATDSNDHHRYIMHANPDGNVYHYEQPDSITSQMTNTSAVVGDPYDQKNNRFIVVSSSGAIYIGKPSSELTNPSVNYIDIDPPNTYDSSVERTTCKLRHTTAVCYRGLAINIGDSTQSTSKVKPEIIKINLNNGSFETIPIKDTSLVFDIAVTADGHIYTLSHKKLSYLEKKGNVYIPKEISQNTDAIVAANDLYFIQDSGVFKVDQNTLDAYQVFYSYNIQPKKLTATANDIFIIGKSTKSNTYSYAWRLNKDEDLNYSKRYIDILPSITGMSYGNADLVENKLYIELPIDRSSTPQSIERDRRDTLEYLKQAGIDLESVTIVMR